MELWNQPLTKENLKNFYEETIEDVYPAVFGICKEENRTQQVIVKSYVDTFQQRAMISGEDVLNTFGEILLNNANALVESSPLPENVLLLTQGTLTERGRNEIYVKISNKIESKFFRTSELLSSDSKKIMSSVETRASSIQFSVSPFLIMQLIVLALIIWGVSYASITVPYRNNKLIPEANIPGSTQFRSISLKDEYISILRYLPFNIAPAENESTEANNEPIESELAPSFATTTAPETKATNGAGETVG